MMKMHMAIVMVTLAIPIAAASQGLLKIGIADSDGPPIAYISHGALQAGLSKDIGNLLANKLGLSADFIVLARKRIEPSLELGRVDIVCNANPDWYGDAAQLKWTPEIYPQIERVATLNTTIEIRQIDDLQGRHIATIQGYNYPTLESMWANGKATRSEEDRLDLMMKSLTDRLTDSAIVSELEFAEWARVHPELARRIKIHPMVVTSVPTMCAVSPLTNIPFTTLDKTIDELRQNGAFRALLNHYQWHPA